MTSHALNRMKASINNDSQSSFDLMQKIKSISQKIWSLHCPIALVEKIWKVPAIVYCIVTLEPVTGAST